MKAPEVKTPNWVFLMQGKNPAYIYAHVTKIGKRYHAKIVGRQTKAIVGYSEQAIEQQLRQLIETPQTN
jgi:hypothetical protein